MHFQAIKTRRSKSRKFDIFKQGLTDGFGPKMAIFLTSFFQAIQATKMYFTIFQNKRTNFQDLKTRSSKSRKIDIFLKGLTHGFGPKMAIFLTFLGEAKQARKMSFKTFQNEKTPFQALKTRSLKSRKIAIFLKGLTHCFGPKMAIVSTCFLQAKQARKMPFTIFWNEKTPFQAIKKRSLKSGKIAFFPKGLTHCFGPKMAIFSTSFFQVLQARKMSFTIFQNRENAFLDYQKRSSKSRKTAIFSKGLTDGFGPKIAIFSTSLFFRQNRRGKCVLRYSRTRKRLFRL